jgi:hypothetical protein
MTPGKFVFGQHCFNTHTALYWPQIRLKFVQKDLPENETEKLKHKN